MIKPMTDAEFVDWFESLFPYGYGSGEFHVMDALCRFLISLRDGRDYDFEVLEKAMGPMTAWLLINVLCKNGFIEFGTSPRYGWLTGGGEMVRDYLAGKAPWPMSLMITNWDHSKVDV